MASVDFVDVPAASTYVPSRTFISAVPIMNYRSIPMMGSPSSLTEERIREMLELEIELLPKDDYLRRLRSRDSKFRVRNQALEWILKVCAHYNFGTLCICLSMNYLDRFLSSYELPKDKSWAIQLLAVSCLS